MTISYAPFDAGNGANVTEDTWRSMFRYFMQSGVIDGERNEFSVSERAAGANMSVDVATGTAFIRGHWVDSDAVTNKAISNGDASNARIDRIVLRADFTANTISVEVLEGTPAASPSAPALTQSTSRWEISLAQIAVAANESTSIVTANITDERTIQGFPQFDYETAPANGETFTYNSTTGLWAPGSASSALADLSDVDFTLAPQKGDRLQFDGANWVARLPSEVTHGVAWYQAGAGSPDSYQALDADGNDGGALSGNTGYTRQTSGVAVNPFPQSQMRRCVLNDDGASVAYYLDCDDSTKKAGDWLRVHEGVDDPVSGIPGQGSGGSTTLRDGVAAWSAGASSAGDRVLHGGKLWEALVDTSAEPAAGTVAATLTGADGQVMVEVPRFYVWQNHASDRHAWDLLVVPSETVAFPDLSVAADVDSTVVSGGRTFTVHPAFQKAGVERSHRYISAYRAYDDVGTLKSVSGQTYTASLTRAAFRTRARARNSGLSDPSGAANNVWHLLDWNLWAAVQMLFLTEYRTFYSQAVLGAGNVDGADYAKTTGRADLGNGSGAYDATGAAVTPSAGSTTDDGVAFRGIEDFWGSMSCWVDGWNANSRDYLISNTPADFADDTATGYTSVATAPAASASYPDSVSGNAYFVPQTVAGSSTTYLTDGHWNATGWTVAYVGGSAGEGAIAGAFAVIANNGSGGAGTSIGAALAR